VAGTSPSSLRVALVTGVTGQDGSYLVELLLGEGYEVHGLVRRTSSLERSRLAHLYADPAIHGQRLRLHYCDLDDSTTLRRLLARIRPQELYHLAGQSHVGLSFEIPESTVQDNAVATLRLLELLRDLDPVPRLFHAASSEVFGQPEQVPQTEDTPFRPVNPYGAAKAFATQLVRIYRQRWGMYAVNGIMYNHESPRRGENFVTRKVCRAAAAISLGLQSEVTLGDLSARRDWGHARDYVRGMWLSLRRDRPDDYVFATGVTHSVEELVAAAFGCVGLDWRPHVRRDERLVRASEPARLVGEAARARGALGWEPVTSFTDLVREMVEAERALLAR
jgi:GDPmannose 4,6-dehydratase